MTKTKKIATTNQKGGVGKTNTNVMLAYLFAYKHNASVLIVSLDRQCNIDSSFGFVESSVRLTDNSSFELLTTDVDINKCITKTKIKNVDIILSSYRMKEVDRILYRMEAGLVDHSIRDEDKDKSIELILKNKLDQLEKEYDYILIDSSPKFDILTENSVAAADTLLIPINPDLYSQEVLALLLEDIINTKDKFNDNLTIGGVFLNKYQNKSTHKLIHQNLIATLPGFVCETNILNRSIIQKHVEGELNLFEGKNFKHKEIVKMYESLVKECL